MVEKFYKMHGLGNDFVILDCRATGVMPDENKRRRMADRHRGVGCDQLILLMPSEEPDVDLFMRIYNPDGSEAGACGNATRCVARLLFEETGRTRGAVKTVAGVLPIWLEAEGLFAVDFGLPRLNWDQIPLAASQDTLNVTGLEITSVPQPCCVSMGNPHAVFFVPEIGKIDLAGVGPKVETHALFPQKTNVEFAQIIDRQTIRMRVWERGAGITQACGSGSCATLVAAVRRGLTDRRAKIVLDGGDLTVEWRAADDHVILLGSATLAFRGEWGEEMFK